MSKPKLKTVPPPLTIEEKLVDLGLSPHGEQNQKVLAAYADLHDDLPQGERSLQFFSRDALDGLGLLNLMSVIVPEYNEFDGEKSVRDLIATFGEDAEYFIARESSVAIYVKTKQRIWLNRKDLTRIGGADEFSYEPDTGMFRLWWD